MTDKTRKSFVAALAFSILAAGGYSADAASFGGSSNNASNNNPSGGGGENAAPHAPAPLLVRSWKPRRHNYKNNCELQKWKYWDGEAYYYRIKRRCRD